MTADGALLENSKDDTRFNPRCLPWRITPDDSGSRVGTIYNDVGGVIATITANSARQLLEIAGMIEDAFRAQEQLSEVNRYYANREQREAGR